MGVNLHDYLIESVNISSIDTLFSAYEDAFKKLGYSNSIFILFPPKKNADETQPTCPYCNISPELVETYLEEKLYNVSPIFEKIKTTGHVVIWSDVLKEKHLIEKEKKFLKFIELLQSHGYKDGITIPVFGFSNSFAHFTFTGNDKNPEKEDIVLLQHLCINLFKRYLQLAKMDNEPDIKKLTHREKEVLRWILKGKSNSIIADIMDISEHTVTTYIRRSCKKLKTSSKWGASITATLIGLIQP